MDLLYEYNAICTHSVKTLSLDVELLQRETCYVDKLEKVASFVEVYIWAYSTNTFPCGHIVSRFRTASKTDTLCGQIGESSLLCRGVYMDLFYKHNAMWTHSANTLCLDVELLQRHTHYVGKYTGESFLLCIGIYMDLFYKHNAMWTSFVEVCIWTYSTNTMQCGHILQTHFL